MDALHSLTLAAALVANRMTVPQVDEYLAQLDPQDARRVRAALEAIGRAMADLMRGAPAPQAVPLAEPRQVLQQVLGDELGRLDDALRFARGKDSRHRHAAARVAGAAGGAAAGARGRPGGGLTAGRMGKLCTLLADG